VSLLVVFVFLALVVWVWVLSRMGVAMGMQWDVRVVLLRWMLGPVLLVLLDALSELEGRPFVSSRGCSIRCCCHRRSYFLGHRRPQRLSSRGRGANALPPRKMIVVKRRRTNSVIGCIHTRICIHHIGISSPIRITHTRLHAHMLIPIRTCTNTDTGTPSI